MVRFEDVLALVQGALRDASPREVELLLAELLEAQAFSQDYYLSVAQEGDAEDVARRISLPLWQRWDTCHGKVSPLLEKRVQGWTSPRGTPMQDATMDVLPDEFLSDPMYNILPDELPPDFNIFSPNPSFEDRALYETVDKLIDTLWFPDDGLTMPTSPRPISPLTEEQELEVIQGKRDWKTSGLAPANPNVKLPKSSMKSNRKTRNKEKQPGRKDNKNRAKLSIQGAGTPSSPQGIVPVSPSAIPQLVQISPKGGPAVNFVFATQVLNIMVPNYILDLGAVFPPDAVVSTPVSTSSDIAFTPVSPVPSSAFSPVPELSPCKDQTLTVSKAVPEKPKCVVSYIEKTKIHMRDMCKNMDLGNGLSMDTLYVEVQLIQRQMQSRMGKQTSKYVEKDLVFLSDVERKEAEVSRSQIFEDKQQKSKRVIALLGKAGMGKTTVIHRICHDWSNGDLPRFDYIFLLNSKALNLPGFKHSLKSLLFDLSSSPPCGQKDTVFKDILDNPQQVMIVFDSFDDFKDYDGLVHSPATSDSKQDFSIKQLFSGLLQKKLLAGCTLLVAARPREVFNQFLGKVDQILELSSFSDENVQLYMSRYFKDPSHLESALKQLRRHPYMYSQCSIPLLCRYVCLLLEHVDGTKPLPSTLTGLYLQVLEHTIKDSLKDQQQVNLTKLCHAAWDGVKSRNSLLGPNHPADMKEFGLECGLISCYCTKGKNSKGSQGYGFAHLFTQNFLGALHLVYSKDIGNKAFVTQTTSPRKKRRPQVEWLDTTRRFTLGLVFQKKGSLIKSILGGTSDMTVKKGIALTYLRSLKPSDLTPVQLLELCHCVYETGDTSITRHLVRHLPDTLSFRGVQLFPHDNLVLCYLLSKAKDIKRGFCLNLEDTGMNFQGLKELLGLKCITSFRASIADTISLWQNLLKTGETELLKQTVAKFTINPFKATHLSHMTHLADLVVIHTRRKLGRADNDLPMPHTEEEEEYTFDIPAMRNLKKLELVLGPLQGPVGFTKLLEILPDVNWLQHLDLEDNKIGDEEAEKLADVVPALTSLEMLNLSQNSIGDKGLEKLAPALSSLSSLHSLSLCNNLVCDAGAEKLASALPIMKSLTDLDVSYNKFTDVGAQKLCDGLGSAPLVKTIRMWSQCIPHGVLERLKQQDPRIRTQ